MASKKFYTWALTFNILTSLLSVLFSLILFLVSQKTTSDVALGFVTYIKVFFDILAVFTGYGTIMYAFTRYDFVAGVKATGIFSISVLISCIWQIIGFFMGYSSDFAGITDGSGNYQVFLLTTFYAFGYCFITQFVPALFVAFCTFFITKRGTDKKTLFRLRVIATAVILLINILVLTVSVIVGMVEAGGFEKDKVLSTILGYTEAIIFYGPIQLGMYYLTHYLYEKYTDKTQQITTNSKKKKKVKKEINNEEQIEKA